jgi:hypothetical protein
VVVPVRGRVWGKCVKAGIWCKYCLHMCMNGKTRAIETFPGMGEKRGKGE